MPIHRNSAGMCSIDHRLLYGFILIFSKIPLHIFSGRKPSRLYPILSESEQITLSDITAQGENFAKIPDAFLIALVLCTGVRTEESTKILLSKFNFASGKFKVIGKGNKEREIEIIDKEAIEKLYQAYLIKRQEKLKELSITSDLLFITNRGTQMSKRSVYKQVSRYMKLAKVQMERLGAHTLRHTAASHFHHHKKVDILVIQQNFGHEFAEITMRYLHLIRKA